MNNDRPNLMRIAARSSTLSERLGDYLVPDAVQDEKWIETRINTWAKAVGKGDLNLLEQRLALDGLGLETVRPYLGRVSLQDGWDLPPWVYQLTEIVDAAAGTSLDYLLEGKSSSEPFVDPEKPFPFEDILIPLVNYGNRLLFNGPESPPNVDILTDATTAGLSRYLLRRLTLISTRVLQREFWQYRVEQKPILALLNMETLVKEGDEPENELYVQFVQHIFSDFWALFDEYSVLARLLVEEINTWVEVMREFLARLDDDWGAIADQFGETGNSIVEIRPGLSDPHNHGRMVFLLEFESGLKLIYKPHSLAMESTYQTFVSWINEHAGLKPLKPLEILDQGTHGWVEVVEQQPCETLAEVQSYYYRLGMLICLMYLLRGTDFHYENIIVNGEYPIPVDLEMLLYPPMASDLDEALGENIHAWERFTTVFHSLILPFGDPQRQGGVDKSFLGASGQVQAITRRRLKYINHDAMHWTDEPFELDPQVNNSGVIFEGELQRPYDYPEQILAGFEELYNYILEDRSSISEPLSGFQELPTRFVFRATEIYFKVWLSSLEPDCLRDGLDRHIQLEHLGRAYIQEELGVQRYWKLFQEEVEALTRNDVPLFNMTTASRDLTTPGGELIPGCFWSSGYQRVLGILRHLSATDLERQRSFIRQVLYAKRISVERSDTQRGPKQITPSPQFYTSEQFLSEAQAIADQLLDLAFYDGHSALWVDMHMDPVSESYYVRYLDDDLYSGSSGVALFLAAMHKVSGETSYAEYALGALDDIRQRIRRGHWQSFTRQGIGGAAGVASLVYALTRCAEFLGEDDLLADAEALAKTITSELIAQDKFLDVIGGSAGAILGLMPLYQATRSEQILAIARACGQHLLHEQVDAPSGGRAWPTLDGKLITGFSHGASGIAYALLKLYQQSGDESLLDAARLGMAYEQSIYDAEASNWPDLRFDEGFMTAWCHGAPGIALARLGGLPMLDDDAIRNDINNGLKTTYNAVRSAADMQRDHLCCGHFGRAEILFTAGQKLGNSEYTHAALDLAASLVEQANQRGGYHLLHGLPRDLPQPGFFNGLAGIGYACLRFGYPDILLPSVLLWE